ncbi:DUF2849 domain-containing protein [Sneathiella limimaris]|uniref:DUF2849 domain-containing protein n=1 Tax=Sneathiella limimaris TaxID=1964213 RepID=UPI00146ECFD6|nr:DUF2849 domain-containing protein [Sneathiella limimaris]
MALQVYSGSLLKEGLVAFLCLDDEGISWTTDLNKATAVEDDGLDALKEAAEKSERDNIIIAPYAVEVSRTETGLEPVENRERIRAYGPTIRLPQSAKSAPTSSGSRVAA